MEGKKPGWNPYSTHARIHGGTHATKNAKKCQTKCKKCKNNSRFFFNFQDFRPGFSLAFVFAFWYQLYFFVFFCHFLGMSSTMNSTVLSAFFESRIWNAKWKSYPNSWAQNQEFGMQDGTHTQTHGGMQKQIPCHNPVCGSESHIILYTIDGTIPLTLLLQSKVSISHWRHGHSKPCLEWMAYCDRQRRSATSA